MLTKKDHTARYTAIEKLRKTRIENVRKLHQVYGSWGLLGRAIGQTPSFLVAIAGPNPRRNIGEMLARDIERALDLKDGWLDKSH